MHIQARRTIRNGIISAALPLPCRADTLPTDARLRITAGTAPTDTVPVEAGQLLSPLVERFRYHSDRPDTRLLGKSPALNRMNIRFFVRAVPRPYSHHDQPILFLRSIRLSNVRALPVKIFTCLFACVPLGQPQIISRRDSHRTPLSQSRQSTKKNAGSSLWHLLLTDKRLAFSFQDDHLRENRL